MLSPLCFRSILLLALLGSTATITTAQMESWVDTEGVSFKGNPAGLVGPLAMFKAGRGRGRRLPLQNLRPEDAYRFETGRLELPARASKWAEGKSLISRELVGNVLRIQDGRLQRDDLMDQAEPEIMLVFYAQAGDERTREMFRAAVPLYHAMKQKYGDDFDAVFVGMRHSLSEHVGIAEALDMPWLVMERSKQSRLDELKMFVPEQSPGLLIITRHGVPITKTDAVLTAEVDQFFAQLEGLLKASAPNNPQTWIARVGYYTNVRKAEFANGTAEPYLVGPPLLDSVLQRIGVTAFEAEIDVDVSGSATDVRIKAGPGIPDKYIPSVARAFKLPPYVPAVSNGQLVAGTLHYKYPLE